MLICNKGWIFANRKSCLRKDGFMQKKLGSLAAAFLLVAAANAKAADLYEECLDKNYMSDTAMAGCSEDEALRVMAQVRKRVNSIAATSYFNDWKSSRKDLKQLMEDWETFRDKYCSLYGYTYTQGKGTISALQTAKCKINMNKRFLDDVEAIVNIYKDNR